MSTARQAAAERMGDGEHLLATYAGKSGIFDEFLGADRKIRPAWERFTRLFGAMSPEDREASRSSSARLVRDDGAAFNVYADPDDPAFAWRLHAVPLLLTEAEWHVIEAAVCQRAQVVSAVLADLYGARDLLRTGRLPPALIFGSGHFIHVMAAKTLPPGPPLTSFAVDLARDSSGRWVVLADQTEAPSGIGYALANRVAMTHGFADLFHQCGIQRLVGYFQSLRADLQASTGRDDGRIVMLAHDPDHPAYFGHAYMARYLGYTLAQPGDLTVRGEWVFLKTLDGLQRVDLLLRQLDAFACDPLEIPGTRSLGIAGLVQSVRRGNVQCVNRLGTGVVQNRVLAPFMQDLCRVFTGTDQLLPDAPALWLGEAAARSRLFSEPERWRVELATARNDPGAAAESLDPSSMDGGELDELRHQLARFGHRYMALAPVPLATMPALVDRGSQASMVPMHAAMRVYASLCADGTWRVMPGALLRHAGSKTTTGLPNGFGAGDVWIVTDRSKVAQGSILQPNLNAAHLRRTGRDLLSRTADNLFWLGRDAERCESIIRVLNAVLGRRMNDSPSTDGSIVLDRLLQVLETRGEAAPDDKQSEVRAPPADLALIDQRLSALIFDADKKFGLRKTLGQVHRTATLVREQISRDAWRYLSVVCQERFWKKRPGKVIEWRTADLLNAGLQQLTAFAGTQAENMTRNYAWRFIEIGRRIGRAADLVDLLRGLLRRDLKVSSTDVLPLLLEVGDSSMTYRSRYLTRPLLLPVLDLLLLDDTNPRSVAWQLERIVEHVERLPMSGSQVRRGPDRRLALKLAGLTRVAEIELLAEDDRVLPRLGRLLDELAVGLPELSALIERAYFSHTERVLTTAARSRSPSR